jgi:pyrroloquinoline-quinone synthase
MTELLSTLSVALEAEAVLSRVDFSTNPYLRDLSEGRSSLAEFQATQAQFFFAVEFFSRPMAALVGRIPDPIQRLDILRNLIEEHGEFEQGDFHVSTFKAFLRSIGVDPAQLRSLAVWPELRAFNSVLLSSCVHDELEVGVACMGIIEQAFATVSDSIAKSVVGLGWVSADELTHYQLHSEIDARHAEEFYRVVEPSWEDPARRYYVRQGLELGAYVFDRLYRDLSSGAGRRVRG